MTHVLQPLYEQQMMLIKSNLHHPELEQRLRVAEALRIAMKKEKER